MIAMLGHAARGAQKFVQEVLWRTYFERWLQLRPSLRAGFLGEREAMRAMAREMTRSPSARPTQRAVAPASNALV